MEEIAQVYARSFFEAAQQEGSIDLLREQLGQFADALNDDRELAMFFFSPYFSSQEKSDALEHAVTGADPYTINFLRLLIDNHRMPVIFRIRREYDRLWEEANKLLPVEVTSAIELDEATLGSLTKRISERTGQRIELSTRVEPDILGGIVVRVGNTILDASIRNRLEQLRRQVARATA
jgi:F-type H+-transporting ATPase subunit delta